MHVVGRQPPPHRIQRHEPVEEPTGGRTATGHPLVEVVMCVDQAGRDDATGRVDDVVTRARLYRADLSDHAIFDRDITGEPRSPDHKPVPWSTRRGPERALPAPVYRAIHHRRTNHRSL